MSVPVSPGSVPYEDLDPWIRADVDESLRRAAEYTKRMREIVEAEAASRKNDKPVMNFAEYFNETLSAVKLSDPSLDADAAFSLAWDKTRPAARGVTLGDPLTDPTPLSPDRQAEAEAIDEILIKSSVDRAIQISADNKPKTAAPALGTNLRDALATIASSQPPMSRDAAMALARAGQKRDREIQIEREALLANPAPTGNSGQVRA